MRKQSSVWGSTIILVLFAGSFFMPGRAVAQNNVSGQLTMSYTQMDSMAVRDAAGHNVSLNRSEGDNVSIGETMFMNNAHTVNLDYNDLEMGSGPHQGYLTFTQGDDKVIVKWRGKVTTTMSDEKTPIISFAGTFEFVFGSGKYKGISGDGTYNGQSISKSKYTVDWEGQYTLK